MTTQRSLRRCRECFQNDFDILATVLDGDTALRETQRLRPDIVVLDISMGILSGLEVARQLRDRGCLCKIVFLTIHQHPDFVHAALAAGGLAYVLKQRLSSDLVPAIWAAIADELFVSIPLPGAK